MKNLKRIFLLAFCLFMIVGSIPTGAIIPYSTYTYDIDGIYVESPHAYVPYETISSATLGLDVPMAEPLDFCTGSVITRATGSSEFTSEWDNMIYISDKGNGEEAPARVIAVEFDPETSTYSVKHEFIDFVNNWGVPDKIAAPQGLYAANGELYVCDPDNKRILVFSTEEENYGEFVKIIAEPKSEVFPDEAVYGIHCS